MSGDADLNDIYAVLKQIREELRPKNGGAILRLVEPIRGYPVEGGFVWSEFKRAPRP